MALLRCEPHDPRGIRRKDYDRFWNLVDDADGDANQCWEFKGNYANHGYGNFWYISETQTDPETGKPRKRYITAHRFSALIDPRYGTQINQENSCVLHHCDNKRCVNPNHVYIGNQKQNVKDMDDRGRRVVTTRRGEDNCLSKLTEDQVLEIRARYEQNPNMTYVELSQDYDVNAEQVSRIIRKEAWSHI